jgi:hypothetical protein
VSREFPVRNQSQNMCLPTQNPRTYQGLKSSQ